MPEPAPPSMRDRAEAGVRWSLAGQIGRQAVQILTTIVLVRLLAPADFGLMGMAMVGVGLTTLFHDLGTAAAVVQRREVGARLLSTIFWVNVVAGIALAAALLALAPLVGLLFREPRVGPLLSLLGLSFLATGPGIVHGALLRRRLAFRALARVELAAVLAGAAVGIGSALTGHGAWSLAHQALTISFVTTLLLWIVCPWRPRLAFSWADVRSIGGFSAGVTGFKVFNYLTRNLDSVLIGRFLGATELGYYALAYRLMLYPLTHVSAVVGRVMFPVLARWQDDHERLRRAFVHVSAAIATVSFPMMIGLMVTSGPLVAALCGPAWSKVGVLLVILAPVGLVQSLSTSLGGIYQAKGRTGLMCAWGAGLGAVVLVAFVVGLRWGTVGVAAAYAVACLLTAGPGFMIPFRLIDLPVRRFALALWPPLACSVAMGALVLGVRVLLPTGLPVTWALAALVTIGAGVYAAVSWRLNRARVRDLLRLAAPRPVTAP